MTEDTLTREEARALRAAERKVAAERQARGRSGGGRSGGGRSSGGSGGGGRGTRRRPARRATTRRRGRGPGRGRATRLVALDAARGLVVGVLVLVVATPAGGPAWLDGVDWAGWRGVDLLAPAAAALSGVSLGLHVAAHARAGRGWWVARTLRRVVVLVAAGVVVLVATPGGWPPAPAAWPWTGPLPRLAVGWVVALVLVRTLGRRGQAVTLVTLLAAHTVLVHRTGARVPEAAAALDAAVLGVHRATPIDPDGLWTLSPTVAALLGGALVAAWWRSRPAGPATGVAAALAGVWVGAAGIVLAQVVRAVPALWTAPLVLLGTAAALLLLGATHVAGQHALGRRVLRWPVAVGALALPVGVGAAVAVPWLDRAAPWRGLREAVMVPLLGGPGGALAAGALVLAVLARVAVALHDRGVDPRA
ncbi:MAG: hypothetical protein ACLGIR_06285 [Actinomycetes bacterium]